MRLSNGLPNLGNSLWPKGANKAGFGHIIMSGKTVQITVSNFRPLGAWPRRRRVANTWKEHKTSYIDRLRHALYDRSSYYVRHIQVLGKSRTSDFGI